MPQPAAKKAKVSGSSAGASTILSFLPAPKFESASGSRGGSSDHFSKAAAAVRKQKQQQQQQQEQAAAAAGVQGPAPLSGNEAFRVNSQPAAAAGEGYEAYESYGANQGYYGAHAGGYDAYPEAGPSSNYATAVTVAAGGSSSRGLIQPGMSETDLIEAAIAAEAAKAAKRGAGVTPALGDVAFKEINAEKLKYVDPATREAQQGIEAVLGSDYVQRLRAEAAPHTGNKTARRKHQIGTLFHNARMNEIKLMEQRAQGMKTKAETAGKYGW
jgi:proline-rich protein PRCC